MKFKKGEKVEVLNEKEIPVSWHVAEILSGFGYAYLVKYDSYPGMSSEHKVETVSKTCVRPCQPLVQGVEDHVAGDVVEIFHEYAWKAAAILNVVQGKRETKSRKISIRATAVQKRYKVRLLGCSIESTVDGSNIRMKQTWQDGKWIMCEKSSQGVGDITASKPSTSICHKNVNFKITLPKARASQKNCISVLDETRFMESHHDSRLLKRLSPCGSSTNELHYGPSHKLQAIEKDGRKQRLAAAAAAPNRKSGSVSYPRKILGEKNIHASLKIIPSASNQKARVNINDVPGIRQMQLNSSNSDDACSVGSCSGDTDRSPNDIDIPYIHHIYRETDAVDSDADSGHASEFERKSNSLPPREEVGTSIRRLELQAYRRTLEALYASGPLSWEQETMLTNLRIMLHISNDEHLKELKHLISANTTIYLMNQSCSVCLLKMRI
ncbi:uncharacterized protein LOC121750212 isoform X2 [Salvia splendens]|uniref:uncharacterized protein LOC121750212 isoform X2 n=1 Tax=Salvia splendens TaxID=180675 RepID=UPI001C271227|nr:uncharacterized protein LOC121750212 isoform X2 [Salvia splendens]